MIINTKTRYLWAEKTLELSNFGAGGLIFGQFLSDKGFQWSFTIMGIILIVVGYLISLVLLQKK